MSTSAPQLGITLYSLTLEYQVGRYTFEEAIRAAGAAGVGPGLEIVGYQSIRGFPAISSDFERRFKRQLDDAGLVATCLGANVDSGRRRDRLMTDDETVEALEAQIEAARRLGFSTMRIQFGARSTALRRVVGAAEKAGVRLGMEIHAPHSVDHPTVVALRELYDEIDSPFLGFIPDFGASVSAMPAGAVAQQRERMPADVLELIIATWQSVHAGERDAFAARRELIADLEAREVDGETLGFAWRSLTLWGSQPPAKWLEIMPRVVHVHGKFFDIDERGEEPSVPYAELMSVFSEGGYSGTISSEWEGRGWAKHPDGIAIVKAHHELMRRHLATEAPASSR